MKKIKLVIMMTIAGYLFILFLPMVKEKMVTADQFKPYNIYTECVEGYKYVIAMGPQGIGITRANQQCGRGIR